MDVPSAHPPAIERDDLFLNPGDVPLVLGDDLRLELAVPVPGTSISNSPYWLLSFFGEWPLRLFAIPK